MAAKMLGWLSTFVALLYFFKNILIVPVFWYSQLHTFYKSRKDLISQNARNSVCREKKPSSQWNFIMLTVQKQTFTPTYLRLIC